MKKLKINWKNLNDLASDFEKNIIEFEKDRLLFGQEINSLIEGWTGIDEEIFQTKNIEYLKDLRYDVDYLYEWAQYFKSTSSMFNSVEESGLKRVRDSFSLLEDEEDRMNNGW